ncbi:MAG: lipoate--protein ligase [Malacoplasma sp.]|nr:lipoate--protein ligase [Malacoplasma sp.]
MKIIKLNSTNPEINLASEHYYLTEEQYLKDDLFLFWKNKNTIVIGKNQNFAGEVNQIFANELNVSCVRRNSGGGAVFQDSGNICFTFIKRNKKDKFNFKECLIDIVDFLNSVGIKANFSGRNDIIVNEKKVSGNAVLFYKNDYLIHGTLLFDVDIEKMVKLLTVDKTKLTSKGIESVKSRVENIKNLVDLNQNDFEEKFIKFFENKYNSKRENIDLTNNKKIKKLVEEKFGNKNWIYGRDFDFTYTNKIRIPSGSLEIKLKTNNNKITDIYFTSDGLFCENLNEFENLFLNQSYEINNIKEIVKNYNLNTILENLTAENIIELFFKNY